MFNTIMNVLKPYGLHHGLILMVLSWLGFLIHPFVGIYISVQIAGYYLGREEQQAENRGFRPLIKSTWLREHFEFPDFLTPLGLMAISIPAMIFI